MNLRAIRQKIARLHPGGRPRLLDLIAGCGGLSLGFAAAGFAIAAVVENDPDAAASRGLNFHPGDVRSTLASAGRSSHALQRSSRGAGGAHSALRGGGRLPEEQLQEASALFIQGNPPTCEITGLRS